MRIVRVPLSAMALVLVTGSAVRADIINFGYSASSAIIYNSNNGSKSADVWFTPASGTASFDTGSGVPSQFIIYNTGTASSVKARTGGYDSFNAVPFNLSVTLTDSASSAWQPFSFAGTYTADHISATSSHVDPSTQGINWTTPLTATQVVGATAYTMKIVSWTAPGAPQTFVAVDAEAAPPLSVGAILAEVTAVSIPTGAAQSGPPVAPEPTSAALAGLAVPVLLLVLRRRGTRAA